MAYSRKDVEKTKMNAKKFVRYQEGAEKYSMGLTKFTEPVSYTHLTLPTRSDV